MKTKTWKKKKYVSIGIVKIHITLISQRIVELLNENIKGFRDIDWWSRMEDMVRLWMKTIKYELCVMISDMYFMRTQT